MRLTPALYVRHLLAKLHPPLPKTPRESNQLLNLLETSFRKHLDEVHPAPKASEDIAEAPQHHNIPILSSSNVAHSHLFSVLTHPLLDKYTGGKDKSQTLTSDAVDKLDEALIRGNVSVKLLERCMEQYETGITNGEGVSENQMLGQRLASWLYAAPPSVKEAFFTKLDLLRSAIRILAIDRQEATAWEWLRIVYERDFGGVQAGHSYLSELKWLMVEDTIVSALMLQSIRRRDLNDAAQQLVEACRYRRESGRARVCLSDLSTELPYVPMSLSWKRLAIGILQFRNTHGIETELFDAAMQSSLSWSHAPHASEAVLAIYHPSSPSSQILCQKLRHAASAAEFINGHKPAGKLMRKAMLIAFLDGAQLSLDQSLRHDARFLLDFATAHYPDLLPSVQLQGKQSMRIQLKNIRETLQVPDFGTYRWNLT